MRKIFIILISMIILSNLAYSQSLELKPIIPENPDQAITMEVGDKSNVIVSVKNIHTQRDTITLTLSTNDELFKNWIWFDGYKYDKYKRSLPVILDPDEQTGIAITIFGGQTSSNNQLTIKAESEATTDSVTFTVNINPKPTGVFAVTPGLNWFSFSIIIFLASLIIWKKEL